jgi:hypothetical protein
MIGSYVKTPLRWWVSFALRMKGERGREGERERGRETDGVRVTLPVYVRDRAVSAGKDTKFKSIADLRGETIGISRIGR